jgi:hypothetical protein
MSDRRRGRKKDDKKDKRSRRDSDSEDELLTNVIEEVRTLDSELDLLKQQMNSVVRELNVIKRVVLLEKQQIRHLEAEQETDKKRFDSISKILQSLRGD